MDRRYRVVYVGNLGPFSWEKVRDGIMGRGGGISFLAEAIATMYYTELSMLVRCVVGVAGGTRRCVGILAACLREFSTALGNSHASPRVNAGVLKSIPKSCANCTSLSHVAHKFPH